MHVTRTDGMVTNRIIIKYLSRIFYPIDVRTIIINTQILKSIIGNCTFACSVLKLIQAVVVKLDLLDRNFVNLVQQERVLPLPTSYF